MFRVKGAESSNSFVDRTVVINIPAGSTGGETLSVKLVGVPIGNYTVTEEGWSWRYELDGRTWQVEGETTVNDDVASKVLVVGSLTTTVTFTNKLTNENWLSGGAYAQNVFNSNAAGNNNGAAMPVNPNGAMAALFPATPEDEDEKKRKGEA